MFSGLDSSGVLTEGWCCNRDLKTKYPTKMTAAKMAGLMVGDRLSRFSNLISCRKEEFPDIELTVKFLMVIRSLIFKLDITINENNVWKLK